MNTFAEYIHKRKYPIGYTSFSINRTLILNVKDLLLNWLSQIRAFLMIYCSVTEAVNAPSITAICINIILLLDNAIKPHSHFITDYQLEHHSCSGLLFTLQSSAALIGIYIFIASQESHLSRKTIFLSIVFPRGWKHSLEIRCHRDMIVSFVGCTVTLLKFHSTTSEQVLHGITYSGWL